MAALKYFLILGIGLCCTQLISGGNRKDGYLLGNESVDPNVPDADYLAADEVNFDEEALKQLTKKKLSEFMSNAKAAGTVTDARQTLDLLLTDPDSSEAIIKLMHIIREAMTDNESLKTIRLIQNLIRDMLNKPERVKNFLGGITAWLRNPQTLQNIKEKDQLAEECIRLTVETECLDKMTKAIRQLNYANAPEVVEGMFKNFDFLVNMNPNFRIQDAAKFVTNKATGGLKSLIGSRNRASDGHASASASAT